MKILWHGVPRCFHTGYGKQTKLFTDELVKYGHKVNVSSVVPIPEHHDESGCYNFSGGPRGYGNDWIKRHLKECGADIILSMTDTFMYDCKIWKDLPWVAWQVVDCAPLIKELVEPCQTAKVNVAMSSFGQSTMQHAGFESTYVPLTVDPAAFFPMSKDEARAILSKVWGHELKRDRFIAVMVAANMSNPSRKNFYAAFRGFRMAFPRGSDAMLYCHTENTGTVYGGEDLRQTAKVCDLDADTLIFPDNYLYTHNRLGDDYLRTVYSAADCLLVSSFSEGFCVPIIEAHACGCPVYAPAFTSTRELTSQAEHIAGGTPISLYSPAEFYAIHPAEVADKLLNHHAQVFGDVQALAIPFNVRAVVAKYLQPLLNQIETGKVKV
jgi:glycosyltransferase involved in cell wall biosynthesis